MSLSQRQPSAHEAPDDQASWVARLAAAESRAENLEVALRSNRRIGMAIGILMGRHGVTEQAAFETLSRTSQRRNRKLRDLAEVVIYTGTLADEEV